MIPYIALCSLFSDMYREHWVYEYGAARRGTVDCSGAFVYAYRVLGNIALEHSSNWIARRAVGAFTNTPRPGYAAFRWRPDSAGKTPTRWQDGRGDFYHIGLVTISGEKVDNAKGTKAGFSRDDLKGWIFAPLLDVDYGECEIMDTPYSAIVTTQKGALNLRAGAGLDHRVLFKLPKGTPILVIEELPNGWALVDDDGTQGYVDLKYITPINASETLSGASDNQTGNLPSEDANAPETQNNALFGAYTRLRRTDGVEIVLSGSWTVEKPPDED